MKQLYLPLLAVMLLAVPAPALAEPEPHHREVFELLPLDAAGHPRQLAAIEAAWRPETPALLLDIVRFVDEPLTKRHIYRLLARKTGQDFGDDWAGWIGWWWNQPITLPAHYVQFKNRLYRQVDPRFADYFGPSRKSLIRLDEVVWGGVSQDGIPPLRTPNMLGASAATYLADSNIVFGIEVNGDARAYPKRILAWHEMFIDVVGGVEVAGVYCTLCGTVILYETHAGGRRHWLGTSGFLYRSNKLMYDRDTHSLWSTLDGQPVVGPLAGTGITLKPKSVVTTTWGEWKARHPGTKVLALDTGHERDYGEGAAYRQYFSSDRLMFPVPRQDRRLANKDEVLIPRFGGDRDKPLAIASVFLRAQPVYHGIRGGQGYVILTDRSGAHRVYQWPPGSTVSRYDRASTVVDSLGVTWQLREAVLESPGKLSRTRLPSHNAFWFGWHAAFPNTLLVH